VVPAVPVPVSAVMLVVAMAVVAVVVVISPVVAVSVGHAAGKDLGYLHAVPPLLPGRLCCVPKGVIAPGCRNVSIGCKYFTVGCHETSSL
jgi:hypothetical protein